MIIRTSTPDDIDALAEIYRASVLEIGITAYTARQAAVWASFADDTVAFSTLLGQGHVLLAEIDGEPAAFCHLHPGDHISLLYTAPAHARRGLATAVYRAIEEIARADGRHVLTTDASRISRPFFERQGFVVRRTEETIRQGVSFERFQMEKRLLLTPPGTRLATGSVNR